MEAYMRKALVVGILLIVMLCGCATHVTSNTQATKKSEPVDVTVGGDITIRGQYLDTR
jgi:hypothetical protein